MIRKNTPLVASAMAMMLLILDSRCAVTAAAEGVQLCIQTVIPSLFPFFLLSIFLTGSIQGGAVLRPLGKLFRISREEDTILVSGLLGGYPVGAQAAAEGYRSGNLTQAQANRLLAFCSQAGPSFLFGMVALQFPEAKYPWLLWLIQILSALTVAHMIPQCAQSDREPRAKAPISMAKAMKKAVAAMASVCGWVVIFRVVIGFVKRWVLWLLPETAQILICGLLELTNGCLMLSQIPDIPARFLMAVLMLNFGGFCVFLQTQSVAAVLDIRRYWLGKLLQAGFSLCYAAVFLGIWWALIPALLAIACTFAQNKRKNSSIPLAVGV